MLPGWLSRPFPWPFVIQNRWFARRLQCFWGETSEGVRRASNSLSNSTRDFSLFRACWSPSTSFCFITSLSKICRAEPDRFWNNLLRLVGNFPIHGTKTDTIWTSIPVFEGVVVLKIRRASSTTDVSPSREWKSWPNIANPTVSSLVMNATFKNPVSGRMKIHTSTSSPYGSANYDQRKEEYVNKFEVYPPVVHLNLCFLSWRGAVNDFVPGGLQLQDDSNHGDDVAERKQQTL